MQQWFVIQTKPHRENDVQTLLGKGGFEVFFPKIKEISYRKGGSFFKTAPLFPGYLFVHSDFEAHNSFHLVRYTRGVNKILSAENRPISISKEIIETIQRRANPEGLIAPYAPHLKPGDRIRVRKGMLKELIGVLEKPVSSEGRVQVLLKLVNYEMRARLHWTEIERLKVAS